MEHERSLEGWHRLKDRLAVRPARGALARAFLQDGADTDPSLAADDRVVLAARAYAYAPVVCLGTPQTDFFTWAVPS